MKLIEKLAGDATKYAEHSTQDFFFGFKTGFQAALKLAAQASCGTCQCKSCQDLIKKIGEEDV